jgi:hypothetical protein
MGGNLFEQELHTICEQFQHPIENFVETGTYKGDTTRLASTLFTNIFTIEIVPDLYNESMKTAQNENITNIKFFLGDSLKILPGICDQLSGNTLFFLDAHQSGHDTSNNGKWVPLMEELDIILSNVQGPTLFVIDDVRLFSKHWDWEGISENSIYQTFVKHQKHIQLFYVENDRLIVSID